MAARWKDIGLMNGDAMPSSESEIGSDQWHEDRSEGWMEEGKTGEMGPGNLERGL